ncbi:MAG: hypothetical protein HY314_05495, partial [Acidobacteria bacterium]|nr:hypothetical protein [Acidobacteriota bacterium]
MLILISIALLAGLPRALSAWRAGQGPRPDKVEYPAPRYPKIPNITTVEQLLPYVRHIVERPMPYSGDQRSGYGIKGGEKILFVTDSDVDPLVVEAFLRVLREEKKCKVDLFQEQGQRRIFRTVDLMKMYVRSKPGPWVLGGPEWTEEMAKKVGYDKVIG